MAPWPGGTRAAGPNGATVRTHTRALQNHTQLLQLQTCREGEKGQTKIGKMGEKTRQRHREGQSYGKA